MKPEKIIKLRAGIPVATNTSVFNSEGLNLDEQLEQLQNDITQETTTKINLAIKNIPIITIDEVQTLFDTINVDPPTEGIVSLYLT